MNSLDEEFSTDKVEQESTNGVDVFNSDSNFVIDASNEIVESKSGRKIKLSRKMSDNFDDHKKVKSKSHKKSEMKKSKRSSNNSPVEDEVEVNKTAAVEVPVTTAAVCGYCHKGHLDDPLESGKMFSIAGVTTHYFCMLFTYNSSQLGADSEGLFGFYGEEVKNQIENGQKRRCKYCAKPGATARCNKKSCGVYMHFPCGQDSGATFQFMGKMHTYCMAHRVKQKEETFPTPPDVDCVICYEKVAVMGANHKRIRAPCCGRHLHRDCVQRFAMTSGTQHFKCPNCNNHEDITKEFKKNGVYIPYKDAEWELPAQSSFYNFQDMYVQTKRCSVKDCICKEEDGRNYNDVDGEFEIVLCDMCGTNGSHIKCGKIDEETLDYACIDCGGDVALEERTFASRNSSLADSSLNLSLASSEEDSFISDNDSTASSIPNIRDFIKQFEIKSSDDSLLKTSESDSSFNSVQCTGAATRNEKSEEIVPQKTLKKRGPKSKTQNIPSVKTLEVPAPAEDKAKHSFFKHTEEVTKMLEDLKKKEQEKKSKDAFFQSLTATAEKKEIRVVENSDNGYDFGRYLTKSLGREEEKKESEATPSSDPNAEIEQIQSKITQLTNSIGIHNVDSFNFESIGMKGAGVPKIKVRTDLMTKGYSIMENVQCDEVNDDVSISVDDSPEGIEISHKRRTFGLFLLSKQQRAIGRNSGKMESEYIGTFYKNMMGKSDAPNVNQDERERVVKEISEPEMKNARVISPPVLELEKNVFGLEENEMDKTLDAIDLEVTEESIADTSNLGIVVQDTYSCSDSFIDELLNSPVKSTDDKDSGHELKITPTKSVNVIPETKLVDVIPPIASSIKIVEDALKNPKSVSVVAKPKAGPRSRTKPTEPPVERTSPTKIKKSIAENIKIFEEHTKAIKSQSHDISTLGNKSELSQKETNDEEAEPTVRYRPGPKSRKKYLVVKEDTAPEYNNEMLKVHSSPKRSLESSEDISTKKQKTDEVTLEECAEVVNLDSTISSNGSNLEIIDLDVSDIATPIASAKYITPTLPQAKNTLDASKETKATDINPTETSPFESASVDDAITEIAPPSGVPSVASAAVSKRASKRPFQCPVCQGFFRSEMVLQQHLAKIHFWNRLLALPKESSVASGELFQCSEFPCRYIHKSKTIVAGHLATEHKIVFKIALSIFPDFKLPILKPLNTTTSDPSITIIASVPARLPAMDSAPPQAVSTMPEHAGKRTHSLSRYEDEQNKKPKPSHSVRPVILPSQPHKAVARVKPRTAPVQPNVKAAIVEASLKPVFTPIKTMPSSVQESLHPVHSVNKPYDSSRNQ